MAEEGQRAGQGGHRQGGQRTRGGLARAHRMGTSSAWTRRNHFLPCRCPKAQRAERSVTDGRTMAGARITKDGAALRTDASARLSQRRRRASACQGYLAEGPEVHGGT